MTDQQLNSIKALAVWIDSSFDAEGHVLPAGIAERVAKRITDAAPVLLDALAEMAKGRKVS